LSGSMSDSYDDDEYKQFTVAPPLARVIEGTLQEVDGKPQLVLPEPCEPKPEAPYLHAHALWTWEFMVQRASGLQFLRIENVDLGSGPLEWLTKGLRTHSELKVLQLDGVHLGSAGGKMIRNVIAQSQSLLDISLNHCGLHDAGLDEIAEGIQSNNGRLETLSLRGNRFSPKRLSKLAKVFCEEDNNIGLAELDLSENTFGVEGAKELGKLLSSEQHRLRVLTLQNAYVDLAAFWRLVNNLSDARPLSKFDLRCNPIGRGTRRIWRSTMGPTMRCEVLLSDKPFKAKKEMDILACDDVRSYPSSRLWV